jgi:hypothetical protein
MFRILYTCPICNGTNVQVPLLTYVNPNTKDWHEPIQIDETEFSKLHDRKCLDCKVDTYLEMYDSSEDDVKHLMNRTT